MGGVIVERRCVVIDVRLCAAASEAVLDLFTRVPLLTEQVFPMEVGYAKIKSPASGSQIHFAYRILF